MPITKQEAKRVFNKLDVEEKQSTHHISGWVIIDGKKTYNVHFSHGRGDMPSRIGIKFAKSFGLTIEEFAELKRCTMSKEKYMAIIRKRICDSGNDSNT